MYATIEEYIADYIALARSYRPYSTEQDKEYLNNVIAKYGDLPQQEANCGYLDTVRDEFYKNIFTIDYPDVNNTSQIQGLTALYRSLFYDPGAMKHLQCSIMKLFNDEVLNQLTQLWKQDIKRIGDESADAQVFTGKIAGYEQLVAFKVASAEGVNSTLYENLIGHFMNKMRLQGILNFAYTYGVVKCQPTDEYCTVGNVVLIQEFIKGVSAEKYLLTAGPLQLMRMIAQLSHSLQDAYQQYGFQHLDMHNQNVMMRIYSTTGEVFYLPYKSGVYVSATDIATVIDFGRSSITIDNQVLVDNHSSVDHDPSSLSELADMFKFLNFLMYSALGDPDKYDPEMINLLAAMIQFFIRDDVIDDIEDDLIKHPAQTDYKQTLEGRFRETYYILPGNRGRGTYAEFINYLATNPITGQWYNQVVTTTPTGPILSCNDQCHLPQSYVTGAKTTNQITSPLDFLIRVNEDWKFDMPQQDYDALTQDVVKFVVNNRGRIPGIVRLVERAIPVVKGEHNKAALRNITSTMI